MGARIGSHCSIKVLRHRYHLRVNPSGSMRVGRGRSSSLHRGDVQRVSGRKRRS
ncbi:hypothetical protein [Candidatus Ichthyocystis sparus]|uniref:hypothetical protein n=1 Tax=Candidatus Ichthyocystis sparus TaxID=1561004 RepID=UPI00159EC830|nr:hypothetical protein [Candidatus Ichthyocystis sparus]